MQISHKNDNSFFCCPRGMIEHIFLFAMAFAALAVVVLVFFPEKHSSEELTESEHTRLQELLAGMPDAILVFNMNQDVTIVNPIMRNIFDLPTEPFKLQELYAQIREKSSVNSNLEQVFEKYIHETIETETV